MIVLSRSELKVYFWFGIRIDCYSLIGGMNVFFEEIVSVFEEGCYG